MGGMWRSVFPFFLLAGILLIAGAFADGNVPQYVVSMDVKSIRPGEPFEVAYAFSGPVGTGDVWLLRPPAWPKIEGITFLSWA